MKTLSLSEAKIKLSGLVEKASATNTGVIITKHGRPAAVLVRYDEFEGWKETIAIRSDSEIMAEIKKGIKALRNKKAKLYTLEKLFK